MYGQVIALFHRIIYEMFLLFVHVSDYISVFRQKMAYFKLFLIIINQNQRFMIYLNADFHVNYLWGSNEQCVILIIVLIVQGRRNQKNASLRCTDSESGLLGSSISRWVRWSLVTINFKAIQPSIKNIKRLLFQVQMFSSFLSLFYKNLFSFHQ